MAVVWSGHRTASYLGVRQRPPHVGKAMHGSNFKNLCPLVDVGVFIAIYAFLNFDIGADSLGIYFFERIIQPIILEEVGGIVLIAVEIGGNGHVPRIDISYQVLRQLKLIVMRRDHIALQLREESSDFHVISFQYVFGGFVRGDIIKPSGAGCQGDGSGKNHSFSNI